MQWNSSNLEARFPALKEDSFLLSFLGLQLFSLGAEWERGRVGAQGHCAPCMGAALGSVLAGAGSQGWVSEGRCCKHRVFDGAGLQAVCEQALRWFSHVCTIPGAETGLPRLLLCSLCTGSCSRARCCHWHCSLLMAEEQCGAACSKGRACLCLSAEGSVHIPSVWLTRETEACWEVQNWVKTLPDWFDGGIWF